MKKLLLLLFLVCVVGANAQDVIVKKDGSTVVCRVQKLTDTEIIYKLWSDQKGDNYIMDRSLAATINYQNGKKEILGDVDSKYLPGNQNDGTQQYNDKVLLIMDKQATKIPQKAKRLKNLGLIGGGILAAIGGAAMINAGGEHYDTVMGIAGSILGVGVIGGIFCYLKGVSIQNKAELYQSKAIYQHDFKFNNGTLLSAGMDMICDRSSGMRTVGFGFRYLF